MRTLRVLAARLVAIVTRSRREAELDEEIQTHLNLLTEEHLRRGLTAVEARAAARRSFGGVEQMKESYRDQHGFSFFDTIAQDTRYALRMIRRNPSFTAIVVLTLALGIGANTAIFSLIEALLLRSLPVRDPQHLVQLTMVRDGQQTTQAFSYPLVRALAEQDEIFAGLCGFSSASFTVGAPDAFERTSGALVTGGYYDTLGVVPIAGRLLTGDDDRREAAPVAVITDGYWERTFRRDSRAIGQAIQIEGTPVTIVGVTPHGFAGATVGEVANI